jgi:hypothetical protein
MACCAFAAFLISQILAVIHFLRRFTGKGAQAQAPAASLWRLDMLAAPSVSPIPASGVVVPMRRFGLAGFRGWALALVCAELIVLVGALQWFTLGDGRSALADEFEQIARVRSLAELKDLCGYGRW